MFLVESESQDNFAIFIQKVKYSLAEPIEQYPVNVPLYSPVT
jgi:hypothetical protein